MTMARTILPTLALVVLLLNTGCPSAQNPVPAPEPPTLATPSPSSLAQQVADLGEGLRFVNKAVTAGAQTPETGADYVYARTFSANSRNSPVGIEIWVFDAAGEPLHSAQQAYLQAVYQEIYGWDPAEWTTELEDSEQASEFLRIKSDFFWESLAQQLAERVFGESITPAMYRFGPHCREATVESCQDSGLKAANRVVVRTYLNARRDPMNPVTRSITYSAVRGTLTDPELIFELQVPNGLEVAGPHQETLDFRPLVAGQQDAIEDIRIWAHLPQGRLTRTQNFDYPDYNLVFVPLRHLVFQGEVENPKQPASGLDYPDTDALLESVRKVVTQIRTPEGGQEVVSSLTPFLSEKYYYMFESGGQGLTDYRNYILGNAAGIGRGLNPDFGRIEITLDGSLAATIQEPEPLPTNP